MMMLHKKFYCLEGELEEGENLGDRLERRMKAVDELKQEFATGNRSKSRRLPSGDRHMSH
jgi:hypothetical protein